MLKIKTLIKIKLMIKDIFYFKSYFNLILGFWKLNEILA